MGAVDSKIKCETNYDNTATATSEIYFTWLSQVVAAKWFSEPPKTREVCSVAWKIFQMLINDTITKEGLSDRVCASLLIEHVWVTT